MLDKWLVSRRRLNRRNFYISHSAIEDTGRREPAQPHRAYIMFDAMIAHLLGARQRQRWLIRDHRAKTG